MVGLDTIRFSPLAKKGTQHFFFHKKENVHKGEKYTNIYKVSSAKLTQRSFIQWHLFCACLKYRAYI